MVKSAVIFASLLVFGAGFLGCSDSDKSKSTPLTTVPTGQSDPPVQWNPGSPFNTGTVGSMAGGNLNQAITSGTGTAPITFSIVSGGLPPGIVLEEATGAITGVFTLAGSFSVSIRATSSPDPTSGARSQAELGTTFSVNN